MDHEWNYQLVFFVCTASKFAYCAVDGSSGQIAIYNGESLFSTYGNKSGTISLGNVTLGYSSVGERFTFSTTTGSIKCKYCANQSGTGSFTDFTITPSANLVVSTSGGKTVCIIFDV